MGRLLGPALDSIFPPALSHDQRFFRKTVVSWRCESAARLHLPRYVHHPAATPALTMPAWLLGTACPTCPGTAGDGEVGAEGEKGRGLESGKVLRIGGAGGAQGT